MKMKILQECRHLFKKKYVQELQGARKDKKKIRKKKRLKVLGGQVL